MKGKKLVISRRCVKRISVIGGSGTGKTILACNLGKVLELEVFHIDSVNYQKNWQLVDKSYRDQLILKKIKEDSWIIDGTYFSTLRKRLKNSDLIIYLDYSAFQQVKGILKRYIRNCGRERADVPNCKERLSLSFLVKVLKFRKNKSCLL